MNATDGFVTITLNDNIKEGVTIKAIEQGTFTISGDFSNDNDQWDKEINMPKGETFTVNFVPKQGEGTTINKSGKANKNGQKSDELHWTVIVNTNRTITDSADENPVFTDELSSNATGHRYKEDSVEIREIPVTPKGVGKPSGQTTRPIAGPTFENNGENDTGNPKMNMTLEKGKAYEIKYTTIPDNPGINESVTYKNEADYAGNKDSSSTTVDFGKAIEKTTSGPNSSTLITDWTIKYNGNEQVIPSGTTITDSWTTGGTTQTGSQKLVDNEGNTAPANAASYVKITRPDGGQAPQYTVDYNENDEKFELTLSEEINYPIEIKYKTKPEGFIASEDFTVTNKTDHGHIETEADKTVTYRQTSLTLSKDRNSKGINDLNYEDKTMEWRITANQAGYDLKAGDKFIDEFTNENMKLVDGTLKVTIGGNEAVAGTHYELDDKGTDGFEIKLLQDTSDQIVITYTTSFDQIKDVNEDRSKNYPNKVTLVADKLPTDPTANSTYNSNSSQKANGSKDGSYTYNYKTKEFTWTIIFNYNSNTLTNAILKDELPEEHEITEATLEKGHINSGGSFVKADEVTLPVDIIGENEFELELGTINQPYKLVYTTKMKDDVMPVDGEKNYTVTNNAELYDGNDKNAGWKKDVEVKHSKNVLDQKNGAQVGNTETIKWNFLYNTAQSKLTNVVISDTFVDDENSDIPRNQLINEESLKVYKVTYTGTTPNNPSENKTEIDRSEYDLSFNKDGATFVLEFDEIDYPIYVEYESMFIGLESSPISNELKVTYNDGDDQEDDTRKPITNFTYGAFASTSAGEFVIVKTDEATGEPLPGVEFTLKNRNGKELLSGTTDDKGVLDFDMKFATGIYYLDEEKQNGYEEVKDFKFELTADGGPYEGKQVVNVANTPENASLCDNFTIKVNDVDGKADPNTEITLTNNATKQTFTQTTDSDGELKFERANLPAGKYEVTKEENGETVLLGEITVQYNENCDEAVTIQPDRSGICEQFEISLKVDNEPREDKELTIVVKDGDVEKDDDVITTKTTDQNGSFTVPSKDLPAGTYDVYKDEKKIGTVEVSYKGDCEAEVTLLDAAAICPQDTITVLKSNGNPDTDVEVTIKDEEGNEVYTGTTDQEGKVKTDNPLENDKTYKVYKGSKKLGEFTKDILDCEYEVKPRPSGGGGTPPPVDPDPEVCEEFTITVKEDGEPVDSGKYTFTSEDGETEVSGIVGSDGTIVFDRDVLPEGSYTATDEDGEEVGTITVTYEEDECYDEINIPTVPGPVCEVFTVTVLDEDESPYTDTHIIIKNEAGEDVVHGTTNQAGQFTIPSSDIEEGTYQVYEGEKHLGNIEVSFVDPCEAVVTIVPTTPGETCPTFTLTVIDDQEGPVAGEKITIKTEDDEVIAEGTTNNNGQVTTKHIEEGTYKVYIGEEFIDTIVVDEDCEAIVQVTPPTGPVCEEYTVKVKDHDGESVEEGVSVTLKDEDGNEWTETTNQDGHVVISSEDLPEGSYTVYHDGEEIGKITVDYTEDCSATVELASLDDATDEEDPKEEEDTPGKEEDDKTDEGKEGSEEDSTSTPSVEDSSDEQGEGEGSLLPKTATQWFNALLVGAILLAIGTTMLVIQRRKSNAS